MEEFVSILTYCGNNVIGGTPSIFSNCTMPFGSGTTAQQDEVWTRFVGIYLSKKKSVYIQEHNQIID